MKSKNVQSVEEENSKIKGPGLDNLLMNEALVVNGSHYPNDDHRTYKQVRKAGKGFKSLHT